jgi:hypothetical protein
MTNDFSTSSFFSKTMRFWWVLVCFMVAGGIIGFLTTRFFSPIYESKAVITSVLDYAGLGKVDDWEEDQLYLAIGDIIGSSDVKTQVIAQAETDGIQLSDAEMEDNFTLNRQDTRWVMRVRDSDPVTAQKLNQIWSGAAIDALKKMKAESETSFYLQQNLNALATCFEQSIQVEPSSKSCDIQNLERIRDEMGKVANATNEKSSRSTLIISRTSFELTTEATTPFSPVLYSRNYLVLAGALIGLFVGLVLFTLGWPKMDMGG